MLHTMFPPSQLVENKLIVWLLFLAKADRRSKKDWETRFWRAHGRAVNVLSFTCSLFLESKTHVQPKFKWHNLTLSGISPRKKNVHELPPEHQSANLPKELFWIIIIPLVWNTRWNWGNLRFAWLNANHLCFCSPLKVTKRCGVHLKSALGPRHRHVGLKLKILPCVLCTKTFVKHNFWSNRSYKLGSKYAVAEIWGNKSPWGAP